MKKKLIVTVLFFLLSNLVFANGFPTFDISNLYQSIKKAYSDYQFYTESISQIEAYKTRLEEIGKGLSLDNLNDLTKSVKSIKSTYKSVNNDLKSVKKRIASSSSASKNFIDECREMLKNQSKGNGEAFTNNDFNKEIEVDELAKNLEEFKAAIKEYEENTLKACEAREEGIEKLREVLDELDSNYEKAMDEIQKMSNSNSESLAVQNTLTLQMIAYRDIADLRLQTSQKINELEIAHNAQTKKDNEIIKTFNINLEKLESLKKELEILKEK